MSSLTIQPCLSNREINAEAQPVFFIVPILPEFCLMPEGADEAGAFTSDAAQGMGGPAGELPEIAGAQVGQLVLFPITPEVLHRVEFRCIRRETFHPDFTV